MKKFLCQLLLLCGVTHAQAPLTDAIFERLYDDVSNSIAITQISNEVLEVYHDFIGEEMKRQYKEKTLSVQNKSSFMGKYKVMEEGEQRLKMSPQRREQEKEYAQLYRQKAQKYLDNLTTKDIVCPGCNEKERRNHLFWEIRGESTHQSLINKLLTRKDVSAQEKAWFAQKRVDRIKELVEDILAPVSGEGE